MQTILNRSATALALMLALANPLFGQDAAIARTLKTLAVAELRLHEGETNAARDVSRALQAIGSAQPSLFAGYMVASSQSGSSARSEPVQPLAILPQQLLPIMQNYSEL